MSPSAGAVTRAARVPALVAFALLAAGLVEAGRLALHRYFAIDELMNAHSSWLMGRGFLPYRDFFEFHFPFLYQLLGSLWLLMSDDPRNVLFLRLAMLGLVFVVALAAFVLNRREGLVAALAAPAILLTIASFAIRAIEIRHDPLAFACFLSGLAALSLERPSPRFRGAAAGILFALAAWSSQKALMYGLPVGLLLAVETARYWRGGPSAFGFLAAWILNRRKLLVAVLAAPAILLTIASFAFHAVKTRPDALAFACFLSGLAVLSLDRPSPRFRGAAAAVLFMLAAWVSRRALMYGLPAGLLLAVGTARHRRDGPSAFGSVGAMWAGGGAVAALVVLYLTVTGSWSAFVTLCFGWAFRVQTEYTALSSSEAIERALNGYVVVCLLSAAGVASSVVAWKRRGAAISDNDILLVACFASSLAYVLDVRATYEYNLIPFLGFVGVFAGRGVGVLSAAAAAKAAQLGFSPVKAQFASTLAVALALSAPALALRRVERFVQKSNTYQFDVLAQVGALTSPGDAVYDNSGSYVARPSASFYFYTDWLMRRRLGDMLTRRIPEDILKSGTVLFFRDTRTGDLPESLRAFLREHFKLYSGDLWLWGQSYRTDAGGRVASRFHAVRKDRYFVEPASLLVNGALTIDGQRIESAVFELESGAHTIAFEGTPSADLHVLWLPRDGHTWVPDFDARPRFSRVL